MIKLHIRQNDPVDGFYPIRLTLKKDGQADLEAEAKISFALTDQDQSDLRWYLEDYLHNAGNAETVMAQQIESMIIARGEELYEKVLAANESTRALWYSIRNEVANLRVEITTGVAEAASIPWELMRDPMLNSPISLRAKAFVRIQPNPNISFVPIPEAADGRVRLLYIASRPGGASDVELRAVANRLMHDLGQDRSRFDIKALRPPTFEQLQTELNDAQGAGRPYHIVHFDGHGTYEDLSKTKLAHWVAALSASEKVRERGYLLFEHPGEDGVRPIDGETLGKLLHDRGVPVLVLNACQSAMHEAQGKSTSALNVHDEVRAIGSLAQAVIDQGIPAVLGMRYSVFVVTAAEYIGQLYAALAKGRGFGEAATEGRQRLFNNPERWVGLEPYPLQDWFVPIVYEAAPITILSAGEDCVELEQPERDPVQIERSLLRHVPEEGFIGRDETLFALDRAFDKHRVVLLHGYAGQGKTSTAVEFARWYCITGGLGNRPLVFLASFETHTDLDDLLNQIGQRLAPLLTNPSIDWVAENDSARRVAIVKRILRTFPILWLWDNVETIAGFPAGTESQWTPVEQEELRDFLKQIKLDDASKVRILLTSRRSESKWLGKIPHSIEISRMRISDAAKLARTLAEERGLTSSDVTYWQPLLAYCAGNPLTLRILVGQAVKMGLRGSQQIARFIDAIRDGEQQIEDVDEEEGRDKSLGASLAYGFRNAFKDDELPIIALLHLFRGTVDVDVLSYLGTNQEASLRELEGKTKESLGKLLDRAKDAGLLTHLHATWYSIHPALPWFLRQLFAQHYDGLSGRSSTQLALKSWVEAIADLGDYYANQFASGTQNLIPFLALEENNLLHARRLAIRNEWWDMVMSCMRGLYVLYEYQSRTAELARLANQSCKYYCDEADEPIPGREYEYRFLTEYRVTLARMHEHDLSKASFLQEKLVKLNRQRAASALALSATAAVSVVQADQLRTLGVTIEMLGHIQRQHKQAECVERYQEAIGLYRRIGAKHEESVVHYNLGHAYQYIPGIRDLHAAESAYDRSLELRSPSDFLHQVRCMTQIANVYNLRLSHAIDNDEPMDARNHYARVCEDNLLRALDLCPNNLSKALAPLHNSFANLYSLLGLFDKAREHYALDAYYEEEAGNRFGAGQTRLSVGLMYSRMAQQEADVEKRRLAFERARIYGEAALRDFQYYEGRAVENEDEARTLLKQIEDELNGSGA